MTRFSAISSRALAVGAGILGVLAVPKSVSAEDYSYYVETAEQCSRWGGRLFPNPDGGHWKYKCDLPKQTKACERRLGPNAFFSPDDGKCHLPSSGGGCFLTTACVENLGLADDCFELSALRKFRDQFVAARADGLNIIEHYYRIAPRIVSCIKASANPENELRVLYALHVLPTAILARLNLNNSAFWLYNRMVARLERKYLGV